MKRCFGIDRAPLIVPVRITLRAMKTILVALVAFLMSAVCSAEDIGSQEFIRSLPKRRTSRKSTVTLFR